MHPSNTPSEKVSKSPTGAISTLIAFVGLSVGSCVSAPNNTHEINQTLQTKEMSEGNIDSIEYCTLVGTTAQIQAGIEFMADMRSLGTIQKFIQEEMKKENITGKVTVKTCHPAKNEEGIYTYIIIHVSGVGSTEVYSRDPAIAQEIIHQIKMNDELYYPGVKF